MSRICASCTGDGIHGGSDDDVREGMRREKKGIDDDDDEEEEEDDFELIVSYVKNQLLDLDLS